MAEIELVVDLRMLPGAALKSLLLMEVMGFGGVLVAPLFQAAGEIPA